MKKTKVTKTERRVVRAINKHIESNSFIEPNYKRWYIGITNKIDRRAKEHEKTYGKLHYFQSYYACSKRISVAIETYISKKGTANAIGSRGAKNTSKWVYVFKSEPTKLDEILELFRGLGLIKDN